MDPVERSNWDGEVACERIGDAIVARCTQATITTRIEMSEYNARRVLALLSVILKIPLGKEGQRIKL